jgi:PEP-CTERM motif
MGKFSYMALGALATAACVVIAAPANAARTITLGASEDGAPISVIFGPVPVLPGANFSGALGTFTVNDISSADDGIFGHVALLTNSINIEGAGGATGHTLDIFATEQGVGSNLSVWGSHFTEQPLPVGWSVTQSTLLDPADGLFTGPVVLASHTFPPSDVTASFDENTAFLGLGPFSVTEEFAITIGPGATGSEQSTILLTGVPEPSTWAMMLLGFAGLGFAAFRSRRSASSIASA